MTTPRRPARGPQVPPAELAAIANRVAARRGDRPRAEVAAAAGLTYSGLTQVELGTATPTLGTLYALAAGLGCHPAELLGGRPPARLRGPSSS